MEATTGEILKLGESLLEQGIEMVTLESTSDYWRIFYYLLEACGVPAQLVNARDVKNLPGRPKSDKHDCVWLAKLTERGMLRPSFVPPHQVRVLRDYTRTRIDLTRDRTRHWQRSPSAATDAVGQRRSLVRLAGSAAAAAVPHLRRGVISDPGSTWGFLGRATWTILPPPGC